MKRSSVATCWTLPAILAAVAVGGLLCTAQAGPDEKLAALRADGPGASLTVFPVALGGRPIPQVGSVVAVLMEKAGLQEVGFVETTFQPPDGASLEQIATAFGGFVRDQGIDREYALYAEYLGSRAGVTEIRAVLVDSAGEVVWVESRKPGDPEFDRAAPSDPMTCCVFLAERLTQTLALPQPPPGAGEQPGKLEQELTRKAGIPDPPEFEAMEQRQALLTKGLAEATITVYPVRNGGRLDRSHAERLAGMLEQAGVGKAVVSPTELPIDVARAMNEQKVLWSLARSFQNHLRRNGPGTDYALYADYLIQPPDGPVGAVHFVVCDRSGEWVIVDFQNSHHDDFQSVAPESADDCDRLAAERFSGYVR